MADPIEPGQGLKDIQAQLERESFKSLSPAAQQDSLDGMLTAAQLKKTDNEDLESLTSYVNNLWTRAKNARSTEESGWYKNLDMAQGRQFTDWDPSSKTMKEQPKLQHQIRLAVNIIEPVVRTELAKTGSSHPTASVSPQSTEDEDIQAAEAGEAVFEWWYDSTDFQTRAFSTANWWRAHTGNGFLKIFYDEGCEDEAATAAATESNTTLPLGQPPVPPAPTDLGAFGQTSAPQDGSDPLATALAGAFGPGGGTDGAPSEPVYGKIKPVAVSPFNLYVGDLMEPDLQEQPWIIHAYVMSIEEAHLRYDDYVSDKDWNPTPAQATILMDPSHLGMKSSDASTPDQTLVKEVWIKPGKSKRFPKGGLVITVGDQVVGLAPDSLPYNHKQYPFHHLASIGTGRFYRRSVITDLIPIQNTVNRFYAQSITHVNQVINPRWWYDEGSLDPRKVTTKPGQMIPVRLGYNKPQALQQEDIPSSVWNLIDRLSSAKDDISGQHQISRASAPGADTAASALSILQEVDDNYLSETYDSIGTALQGIGRQVLALAVQYWDAPRLVKITGADDVVDVQMLESSDLVHGTDLKIDDGSALPLSKNARIATITDWMEKGFITPETGMNVLEMGLLGKTYKMLKVDHDQVTRENLKLAKADPAELDQFTQTAAAGQLGGVMPEQPAVDPNNPFAGIDDPAIGLQAQPGEPSPLAGQDPMVAPVGPPPAPPLWLPLNDFDNDAIHIMDHGNFMKGQRYDGLPQQNKDAFLAHFNAHIARQAQSQMAQAPAPGGKPGASSSPYGSGLPNYQALNAPKMPEASDAVIPQLA